MTAIVAHPVIILSRIARTTAAITNFYRLFIGHPLRFGPPADHAPVINVFIVLLSPRKRGIMESPALVCLSVCLFVCLFVTTITK